MVTVVKDCESAVRRKPKADQSKYNYAKLKTCLLQTVFGLQGQPMVHAHCLQAQFMVSRGLIASVHRLAVSRTGSPTMQISVACIRKNDLYSDVVVPEKWQDKSQRQFINDLGVDDKVIALSWSVWDLFQVHVFRNPQSSSHGLFQQPSNHTNHAARALFVAYVKANRSSTGRTRDKAGRFHGAEYYISARWTKLRKQTGADRANVPDAQIFSETFSQHLLEIAPGIKPVNRSTVACIWFPQLFGVGSEHGHTTLHPHKSDACPACMQYEEDVASCTMSMSRHRLQGDRTAEREAAVAELEQAIKELFDENQLHRDHVRESQEDYSLRTSTARAAYTHATALWKELWTDLSANGDRVAASAVLATFIESISLLRFQTSCDYQMDKLIPAWNGLTPQPGPTYFLSKATEYVHIICSPSCGDTEGETRFGRNVVYIRPETGGGSKDTNDTISTLFDWMTAFPTPSCPQPKLYRSG
jgi:hypothetical protein